MQCFCANSIVQLERDRAIARRGKRVTEDERGGEGRGEGGTHSLMNYVAANGPQMKSGHKCECECERAWISSE